MGEVDRVIAASEGALECRTQGSARTTHPVHSHVDKGLGKGEEAKDDPVGEPLHVILGLGRLKGLHGEVGRGGEADELSEEASEDVEEDELLGGAGRRERIRWCTLIAAVSAYMVIGRKERKM